MDRSSIIVAAIAVICCALPAASEAQTEAVAELAPVNASISSSAERWDHPVQVVLRFSIAPHWHLYWSNPGDAGLAPSVRWHLPAGFHASKPRFPTPKKIVTAGLISFGYYDELILLTTLTPPPGYQPRERDTIQADVEWLVCLASCQPGSSTLRLPCSQTALTRQEALDAEARFALTAPVPSHVMAESPRFATASRNGAGLDIRFASPVPASDFFPDLIDEAVADHSSIRLDGQTVSLRVQPSSRSAVIHRLRGILIGEGRSYSIDLPVRCSE